MSAIKLIAPEGKVSGQITIGGSKSISNRALIIRALSQQDFRIINLSKSDDTRILQTLLESTSPELDCGDAGTTLRFLTAFLSIQDKAVVLTGSKRLKERPVGPLVEALREIGADIDYLGAEGYPPLKIGPYKGQKAKEIHIEAGISSQFISALCMIAPSLPSGLNISLKGDSVSQPYVEMTLKMMTYFGIQSNLIDNVITINSQKYIGREYSVESDWSSASYFFAIAAISDAALIELKHFTPKSLQGDAQIRFIIEEMGCIHQWEEDVLRISSVPSSIDCISLDFTGQPDLFQSVAVIAAANNLTLQATGLSTLAIKETDRVAAMRNELRKVGVNLSKNASDDYNSVYHLEGQFEANCPEFMDYGDHRMVMSLACIAARAEEVIINNPDVVSKSYPDFWRDLETLGFQVITL